MGQQLYGKEGDTAEFTADTYKLMSYEVRISQPGSNGLLFLPYLMGERCPWWDRHARGAFVGLTIRHTRADMVRAVFEGIALNLRLIFDIFRQQGTAIERLPVIGGGAKNLFWIRVLADILGVPIQRLRQVQEATSIGAAVVGGVAAGIYDDFSIIKSMNPVTECIEPDSRAHERYETIYQAFKQAYNALVPVNCVLNGTAGFRMSS